jgi:hypothetical protein
MAIRKFTLNQRITEVKSTLLVHELVTMKEKEQQRLYSWITTVSTT